MIGQAADISCYKSLGTGDKHLEKFHNIIMNLMNEGKIEKGAIAPYWTSGSKFIHFDVRGYYVNFKGSRDGITLTKNK